MQERERRNIINLEEYRRNREQPQATPQIEMPEGYSINEFGEIIRPTRDEQQPQEQRQEQESRTSRFGATINPSSYTEHLQPISQQNENKLSLKQRLHNSYRKIIIYEYVFCRKICTSTIRCITRANAGC